MSKAYCSPFPPARLASGQFMSSLKSILATTDAKRLAVEMQNRHDAHHMCVVFSTYHSLDVISRAQQPQLRAIRISKLNRIVSRIS